MSDSESSNNGSGHRQDDLNAENSMLDSVMVHLKALVDVKVKEINKLEAEALKCNSEVDELQTELTHLSDKEIKLRGNIDNLLKLEMSLETVLKLNVNKAQLMEERNACLKESQEATLEKYKGILEQHQSLYSSLPRAIVRGDLRKQSLALNIDYQKLKVSYNEENNKLRLMEKITEERINQSVVDLAKAYIELKEWKQLKKKKLEQKNALKEEIARLKHEKSIAKEVAAKITEEAVHEVKERLERYNSGLLILEAKQKISDALSSKFLSSATSSDIFPIELGNSVASRRKPSSLSDISFKPVSLSTTSSPASTPRKRASPSLPLPITVQAPVEIMESVKATVSLLPKEINSPGTPKPCPPLSADVTMKPNDPSTRTPVAELSSKESEPSNAPKRPCRHPVSNVPPVKKASLRKKITQKGKSTSRPTSIRFEEAPQKVETPPKIMQKSNKNSPREKLHSTIVSPVPEGNSIATKGGGENPISISPLMDTTFKDSLMDDLELSPSGLSLKDIVSPDRNSSAALLPQFQPGPPKPTLEAEGSKTSNTSMDFGQFFGPKHGDKKSKKSTNDFFKLFG